MSIDRQPKNRTLRSLAELGALFGEPFIETGDAMAVTDQEIAERILDPKFKQEKLDGRLRVILEERKRPIIKESSGEIDLERTEKEIIRLGLKLNLEDLMENLTKEDGEPILRSEPKNILSDEMIQRVYSPVGIIVSVYRMRGNINQALSLSEISQTVDIVHNNLWTQNKETLEQTFLQMLKTDKIWYCNRTSKSEPMYSLFTDIVYLNPENN